VGKALTCRCIGNPLPWQNLRSIGVPRCENPDPCVPPIVLELLRQTGGGGGDAAGDAAAMSARLRAGGAALRATAAQQVETQLRCVEEAIRNKLTKTRTMVLALQAAAAAVDAELAAMSRCHQRLKSADAHLRSQSGLNAARQQVRGGAARPHPKPAASSTAADEVGRQLLHQQLLLEELLEKAARCARLVESATARLQECCARLGDDLKNKGQTLSIDEAVLGLHGGGGGGGGGNAHAIAAAPAATTPVGSHSASRRSSSHQTDGGGRRASSSGGASGAAAPAAWAAGRPGGRRRWEGDSASLVAVAQQLAAESGRLRKKVKQLLLELSAAVVGSAHAVNSSLADRIHDTRQVRAQLQERLRQVEAEALRAAQEKETLRRSLGEKRWGHSPDFPWVVLMRLLCIKRGPFHPLLLPSSITNQPPPQTTPQQRAPLEQLQARLDLRRRRPGGEHVNDEVESALAAEAPGLAAVARRLERHEAAVGEQVWGWVYWAGGGDQGVAGYWHVACSPTAATNATAPLLPIIIHPPPRSGSCTTLPRSSAPPSTTARRPRRWRSWRRGWMGGRAWGRRGCRRSSA
jgi:hypothetical protein